jgi:hypothetical protein
VRHGGHAIPEATIRRRFEAGSRLFTRVCQPLVDQWILYDSAAPRPVPIDWSKPDMTDPKAVNEPAPQYQGGKVAGSEYFDGALAAMRRAALRARGVAQLSGTDLVIVQDGRIVHIPASELDAEALKDIRVTVF